MFFDRVLNYNSTTNNRNHDKYAVNPCILSHLMLTVCNKCNSLFVSNYIKVLRYYYCLFS